MKELLYISHKYENNDNNKKHIEKCVRELYKNDDIYDKFCIVSPVHTYGFMYEDTEYYKGLSFCTDLLEHCKYMLVLGDYTGSKGVAAEIELCKEHNKIYIISDEVTDELIEKLLKL